MGIYAGLKIMNKQIICGNCDILIRLDDNGKYKCPECGIEGEVI